MKRNKQNHQYRPYRLLTREEEQSAWERGDHNALVESVWPFVLRTVGKLAGRSDTLFDELLSESGLHLSQCLKNYDANQGRFLTYAGRYLFARLASSARQYRQQQFCELPDHLSPAEDSDSLHLHVEEEFEKQLEAAKRCGQVVTELRMVLTDNESQVVDQRLKGDTFLEIGHRYGFSRQRAQQLFASARLKAREMFPSLVET